MHLPFLPTWAGAPLVGTPKTPVTAVTLANPPFFYSSHSRHKVSQGVTALEAGASPPCSTAAPAGGKTEFLRRTRRSSVNRARRDALDIGFLDYRRQRLLGHTARLQETGEIAAFAQLRDAQLDGAGPGLPIALAIPVAMGDPIDAAFTVRRAGEVLNFQLHQPMRGETDHLAQRSVSELFSNSA